MLKTGANVFLTGEPGSGKTYTINQFVKYLRERGIDPSITASTGIAATHIGGMTIHSWSGVGIRNFLSRYDLDHLATNEYLVKRLTRAKILIIDEVSMLSPDILSAVDAVCREIRRDTQPFGGLQTILVGDFFQLPPIFKNEISKPQSTLLKTPAARFAYESPVWKKSNFLVCYLTEQHRQEDTEFFSLLSAVRQNDFRAEHLNLINERIVKEEKVKNKTPKIFSHNVDVDAVNEEMLAKIKSEERKFEMHSHGSKFLVEVLKKGCLSPEILKLKIGAEVMFTKNDQKSGFVNGTLGVVVGFDEENGLPIVRTRAEREIVVEAAAWAVEENGRVRAEITQLPLRLAWAITVHKSQGMSLDEAVIDLSDAFEYGQGYVALSRLRSFSGLHLLGHCERAFEVHPDVLEKDKEFRTSSEANREAFFKIPENELKTMHRNFVVSCGGLEIVENDLNDEIDKNDDLLSKKANGFEEIRKVHPNAYRSWEPEHDQLLEKMFSEGRTLNDIAQTLGRKKGGITARMVRLGLVESRQEARERDRGRVEMESEPVDLPV